MSVKVPTQGNNQPLESNANVSVGTIRELLAEMPAVDREALRRYYADNETEERICRALGITSARFRATKNAIRTRVMSRLKESKHESDSSK